ncbi:MAG: DNA-directed RNA polymerase, subunit E'' [Candidatus Iainarchaeum archaeon]|uniref:Transcription elongation factor Spt4 n=1 Tax=Candidatus Iainarchaeum sp. TaxID=3101447 RepID=A0A7T9DK73_9ARCH|nr:MAG: DNA-directed RNA polymerase, subunit E'' [Candidatus Diapherotrites archaeon]
MKDKACRVCHKISEDVKVCPACNSSDLTTFWSGFVIFVNAEKSAIAQKMGVTGIGKYAVRMSR